MIRHPSARALVLAGCLLIAAAFMAGMAAAQSQLPGTALTIGPGNDLRPAWSPDGNLIAFFSNRSGNNEIWVMDADGANQRQLTNDSADDRRPAWSPDGAWIAFDSDHAGSRDIWVVAAEGGQPMQATTGPSQDSFAAWSPDGAQIAYYSFQNGSLDIWKVEVADLLTGGDPGQPAQVTNGLADERRNECTFACHVPAWSPDGARIAYAGANHSQIWVVGTDGSDPHPLTDGKAHTHYPWWTADGKLLYLQEHTDNSNNPVNDVWVMNGDGQGAALLFPDIPHGGPLYWRPDGSATIVFHSPRAGNFDIYAVVLGQEMSTPQPMVATAMPDAAVLGGPVPAATLSAGQGPAGTSGVESTGFPGTAIAVIAMLVIVLGGGGLALYLARRRRPS